MSREKEEDKNNNKKDKMKLQKAKSNSSVISMKEALRKRARRKRLETKKHWQSANPEIERLKQDKVRNWLSSVGIFVTLISAFFMYDHYMTSMKIQEAMAAKKTDIMWMRQINHAIMAMRTFEDKLRERKQEGEKIDLKKFNIERLDYRKEVGDAYSGVNNVVDSDIKNSVELYNEFDESVPNILAKKAPSDSAWRYYLIRNDFLFNLEIQKENAIIRHEQQFILTRFFGDTKFLIKKLF